MGRVVIPFGGVYDATKFALEAINESLSYELKPLGVAVSIVQPGPFATELVQKVILPSNLSIVNEYGVTAQLLGNFLESYTKLMQDSNLPNKPQQVADAILELIETPNGKRPLRVVVDKITGDAAKVINETANDVQHQVLKNFSLEKLLSTY